MKKLSLIILLIFAVSGCDGLTGMLDNLEQKVPICVDSSVAASGNGRGWKNAYKTIQEAVTNANPGDIIWVAGIHTVLPTVNVNKKLSFYGGFSGTESRLNDRNLNAKTVVLVSNSGIALSLNTSEVIVDGFIFKNGSSSRAIRVINDSTGVKIKNCDFEDNTTSSGGGAAILIAVSEVLIENCTFNNNTVTAGTGAAIQITTSEVLIENCAFNKNAASGNGGAVDAAVNCTLKINNSEFFQNTASSGGAISATNGGTVTITDCHFGTEDNSLSGNSSNAGGGAINLYNITATINNSKFYYNKVTSSSNGGGAIYFATGTLNNSGCTFDNNNAVGQGGGIFVANGICNIDNCNISNNVAAYSGGGVFVNAVPAQLNITNTEFDSNKANSGLGGAVCIPANEPVPISILTSKFKENYSSSNGGAVYSASNSSESSIISSYFYKNNSGGNGGAISVANSSPILTNLTFYSNTAVATGGAIYFNSTNNIYNSVFYNNTDNNGPGTYNINTSGPGVTYSTHNCYHDGVIYPSPDTGHDILNETPFLSTSYGTSSFLYPANNIVNKGLDSAPGLTATDLAGKNRKVGTVDIGAYERQ